jgi:hypothetical protein
MVPAPTLASFADLAVAEVGEVVRLGAAAQVRLLRLDEVADLGVSPSSAVGAEVREGADLGALAESSAGGDGVGQEPRAGGDLDVGEHAADVDAAPSPMRAAPAEHHAVLDDASRSTRVGVDDARSRDRGW